MLIKLSMMYPANQDEPTTILEAMGDIYASPVRGRKISLEGQLVGRWIPGYIFSEDMLMQDKTGLIYVDYESRFGWIGNLFYSLKKAAENIGKDVRTSGWFFRDMSSRIVADRITGEGIDLKGGVRLWMLIGIMLMTVVSGVVGVMANGVYEESKRLTVEQIYAYPVPQWWMNEKIEQTTVENNQAPEEKLLSWACSNVNATPEEYFSFDPDSQSITWYRNPPLTSWEHIEIPCSISGIKVLNIAKDSFSYKMLGWVKIPFGIVQIGDRAFQGNRLTWIEIPDTVEDIGDYAFFNNRIQSIKIPLSVSKIGKYAFYSNQIDSVVIPPNITTIEDWIFHTNKLTSIIIPDKVERIGKYAFSSNQIESVIIPSSVTSIDEEAFVMNKLSSVTFNMGLKEIGNAAFKQNDITSLVIPSSVEIIGDDVFYDNKLAFVSIPSSVMKIGQYAFSDQEKSNGNGVISGPAIWYTKDLWLSNTKSEFDKIKFVDYKDQE